MATPAAVAAVLRAARPSLRGPADAVFFGLHACCLCEGLRLVATGPAALLAPPPAPSAEGEDVGPDGWQALGGAEWAMRYAAAEAAAGAPATVLLTGLLGGDGVLHADAAREGGEPGGAVGHAELRCVRAGGGADGRSLGRGGRRKRDEDDSTALPPAAPRTLTRTHAAWPSSRRRRGRAAGRWRGWRRRASTRSSQPSAPPSPPPFARRRSRLLVVVRGRRRMRGRGARSRRRRRRARGAPSAPPRHPGALARGPSPRQTRSLASSDFP